MEIRNVQLFKGLYSSYICSSCFTGYFGSHCNLSCLCQNGNCSLGINGNGTYCNNTCLCINGTCNSGSNGTAKCISCDSNYTGDYCNITCSCPNGVCDS